MQLAGDLPGKPLLRGLRSELLARERSEQLLHLGQREVRRPLEVVRHERVIDGHDLTEDLVRRVGQPDARPRLRLAHLLAVEALEEGHDEDLLGPLPELGLQLAAGEDVEELVGAAHLDVGLDRDGVVCLEKRVQQVLDGDGRLLLHALAELLALEHLLRGELRREVDDVPKAEPSVPLRLKDDPGVPLGYDHVELLEVGLGVLHHLLVRHGRTRLVLVGRIADLRRPVADDEHDLVAPASELAQLAKPDRVADVQVRTRRVEALLDTQRPLSRPQQRGELLAHDDVGDTARQELVELRFRRDRGHATRIRARSGSPATSESTASVFANPAVSIRCIARTKRTREHALGRGPYRQLRRRNGGAVRARLAVLPSILAAVLIAGVALATVGAVAAFAFFSADLPAPEELAKDPLALSTKVYDRTGTMLLYQFEVERREIVSLDQVPQQMIDATLGAEDKTFWTNPGVDVFGILRAARDDLLHRTVVSGASTITQQLVKQRIVGDEVSVTRKIKEAILSVEVTRTYSKKQILELYLNQIYYGNQAYGIKAAAETYFGKSDLSTLTLAESALLAGLPQQPSALDPSDPENVASAKARRAYVLGQMVDMGAITEDQAAA